MRHRKSNKKQAIPVEKKEERYRILKTETGLAPVPPLGVVAVTKDLLASCSLHLRLFLFYSVLSRPNRWVSLFLFSFCRIEEKNLGCWCCRVASSLEMLQEISQQKKKSKGRVCLLDGVTGPQTNPLGDRTVLLLGFGKLLLGAETLVALYK